MNVIRWPEPISEHGRLSEGKWPQTLLVKLSSATSVVIVRLPGNIA